MGDESPSVGELDNFASLAVASAGVACEFCCDMVPGHAFEASVLPASLPPELLTLTRAAVE